VIKDEMMRRWGLRPRSAWRHAHGWTQSATASAYNRLYDPIGQAPMSESRIGAYERWPHGGERPSLQILSRLAELFNTTLDQVVDGDDLAAMPEPDLHMFRAKLRESPLTASADESPDAQDQPRIAYRDWGKSGITNQEDQREVVAMAAHEGSEHAERAERRDIGEATLEQLRADVERLSRNHMTGEPFAVFQEMRLVRSRIYMALDRQLWPRDQTELYFLLSLLHALMAAAANGLGNRQAAEELIRAGWAYAVAIDHRPLMATLRLELANIVYWLRPRHSRDLARSGLEYLSDGPNAAQLHLRHGRAAARLGDADTARQAITAAHEARARTHHDEVLEIGGEFDLSKATQHFLAGSTLLEIQTPDAQREALRELRQASTLYTAGPEPGEDHYDGYVACNSIDLATALLRDGQLDAAAAALEPVLGLPPDRRIEAVLRRLHRMRPELAAANYQGQALANDLDQTIEAFAAETIVGDLGELPAGPS
jgi:transcriptional regulator with XRE-family HTH domain